MGRGRKTAKGHPPINDQDHVQRMQQSMERELADLRDAIGSTPMSNSRPGWTRTGSAIPLAGCPLRCTSLNGSHALTVLGKIIGARICRCRVFMSSPGSVPNDSRICLGHAGFGEASAPGT